MATTRRQPPLQIFQDPITSTEAHDVPSYDPRLPDASGSVTDVSSSHHTLLEPPQLHANGSSPRKTRNVSSSPPPSALTETNLNAVKIPPPREHNFNTDSPMKKMQRPILQQQPHALTAGNRLPAYPPFPAQFDKENSHLRAQSLSALHNASAAEPPAKPGNKRVLQDAAPLRDRSKKQKIRETTIIEEDTPLPEPDQMPPVEDEGTKPPYSYAHLIGMAILRAPNRRLTLAQIYKWISDTFAFYRNSQDTGWQNSIRHNLSLSKSFSKQERPKDDPGKGHYWRINPGFEKQYFKVKSTRRPTNPDGFVPAYPSDLPRPSTSTSASFPPPLSAVKSIDSSKFPEETELSSDATIPCSDPAAHDGGEPSRSMPPPRQIPSSPPPADIQSSPPAPVTRSIREDTPPRAPRFPTHSRSGGRKRKFGLGDSGYYSSIESSAIKLGPLLTSEADGERPMMKRGRAEEEIARIRGSSYESPSKTRPYMKRPGSAHLTSSPFRSNDRAREEPLTPAIVFKRPALPPPSASPNTNLRNHRKRMRDLVGGSPDKTMPMWIDSSWSPAVQVPNEESVNLLGAGFADTYDVFGEAVESPLKRPTKRPRLERAATTGGLLADVTGLYASSGSPTPNFKSPFFNLPALSPLRNTVSNTVSQSKAPTSNPYPMFPLPKGHEGHPTIDEIMAAAYAGSLADREAHNAQNRVVDEDIFGLLHSDESEPGIDLLQGFEKIGARSTVAPNGSPSKAPRPSLTRSASTRF
ncbi:hypothetical protein P154DRAFT_339132 [Amniculicola lignicola CBS 123094]|uniref:Fork-head domain-containing protein n=1 Tax=Amniculicola lignicola CBS 123094 TaxID=1392246 RepID=A0A6A5WUI3_9PLEO|nr:hypothetical protein P154DRAFT_339132 [Amniculicola lignicola CBS 123094]